MGRKRGRSFHSKKNNDPACDSTVDNAVEHKQSLVDDVREARDIEFAAEKRNAERSKRRKVIQEQKISHPKARKQVQADHREPVKKLGPEREGPERGRKPASRKDLSQNEADLETHSTASALDAGDLNKSGIDLKTSTKIYETAKQQRAEIRDEYLQSTMQRKEANAFIDNDLDGVGEIRFRRVRDLSGSDDDSDEDDFARRGTTEFDVDSVAAEEDGGFNFLDATKITDEEEVALSLFSPGTNVATTQATEQGNETSSKPSEQPAAQRVMLADIILGKIREKQEADAKAAAMAADPARAEREKKIAEVYGLVGNIMSRYRSGKVPKAFKVIPMQRNWEDLLYLTRPDEWSPAAVYAATRLLASNLRPKQVVRYYSDILLPRCLDDIAENKKLNYHLYKALGKAVYKPEAFCKGILFPLCEDPCCTLRQATIIGSIVAKVSIPMLHSAAALLYICELPYSPPNSIITTALIEKKYALPYRVLDAIVEYFLSMKRDPRPLPLMWHQSLLSFAQRYKTELSMEQKEDLKVLMRVQTHHAITPEIRRELFSARNRGDVMDPDADTIARNVSNATMGSQTIE